MGKWNNTSTAFKKGLSPFWKNHLVPEIRLQKLLHEFRKNPKFYVIDIRTSVELFAISNRRNHSIILRLVDESLN